MKKILFFLVGLIQVIGLVNIFAQEAVTKGPINALLDEIIFLKPQISEFGTVFFSSKEKHKKGDRQHSSVIKRKDHDITSFEINKKDETNKNGIIQYETGSNINWILTMQDDKDDKNNLSNVVKVYNFNKKGEIKDFTECRSIYINENDDGYVTNKFCLTYTRELCAAFKSDFDYVDQGLKKRSKNELIYFSKAVRNKLEVWSSKVDPVVLKNRINPATETIKSINKPGYDSAFNLDALSTKKDVEDDFNIKLKDGAPINPELINLRAYVDILKDNIGSTCEDFISNSYFTPVENSNDTSSQAESSEFIE